MQAQTTDSLLNAFENAASAEERLALAGRLCSAYSGAGHDSTHYFCQEAITLGHRLNNAPRTISALTDLGFLLHRKSKYPEALKLYYRALSLCEEQQLAHLKANTHNNIAITHQRMAQSDSAFFHWSNAEKLYSEVGNSSQTWKVYSGLFGLFRDKQDTIQANHYAQLAYQLVKDSPNRADRGYLIFQLQQYYFQTSQFEQMALFQRRWDNFKREQKAEEELMQQPEHIALYMYGKDEQKKEVEQQLLNAIAYFEQSGVPYRAGWTYEDLAKLYYQSGQNDEAVSALQQALRHYNQAKVPYRRGRALKLLYKWKKEAGQPEEALYYLEKYENLEDSLQNITTEKNLNALRVKAETEKKEQGLQIKELELEQKTQERNIFLFSSLLLAALAAAIFLGLRQRLMTSRRIALQEQQLQQQQIRQLEQQAKLSSMQAVIQGQEQERLRIANDLHDSLGGLITSAQNHFSAARQAKTDDLRQNYTRRTAELIKQAGQEMRRISQNLMPRSLTLLGLEGAMEDLANQLREQGVDARFQAIGLERRLPEETAVTLYRIAQELTNNILKHAGAQVVLLQLLQRDGKLFLTVEDDGKGFDPQTARNQSSLGMSSIASRTAYLSGSLDIDSTPGQGTIVTVEVPLQ